MRSTASTSPARQGKQHLLTSCAIAAGLAALALGGPARAQVLGSGEVLTGTGLGTATIDNAPVGKPNTTQVVANGNQTVINWTPSGTAPAGSPIEFLAAGNTLEYYGTGNYTVLNRFVARDGAGNPIPLAQQVAINGNVNSYVGSPAAGTSATQGGNIWFYNAGGILIGATAVLNVGSLVLTANDIDTNGGLFGPGGEIRFRGAAGSTSTVEIAPRAFINALNPGNPGSSYVALVAPRIVQAGTISSDGSTALVAAEQADITISNSLFDINVTIGAEGGNAIAHSGITGGPRHQQGDTDQNRVYMVAIPKNDAVTMLISGQVGYQDALIAQTEPNGAVRLSAGYNIVDGELAAAPVNTTAANMVVNDTLFTSSVFARASGDFTGQPLATIPVGGPVVVGPSPNIGRLVVQGDGTFIGDRSATITIGAGQSGGATGNFTLQSNGVGAVAGNATLNVNTGGLFRAGLPSGPGGNLSIIAGGRPDAATGDSRGGIASLAIDGGNVQAVNVAVSAAGTGGIASDGSGGDGFGGTAGIMVTNSGGVLVADTIGVSASGRGGGVTIDAMSNIVIADNGGNGTGGAATIIASGGGNIVANGIVTVTASGAGQIGNLQSGDGQGGTARVEINGSGTSFTAASTTITAGGIGGGTVSSPNIGTFPSLNGGAGSGGTAELVFNGDMLTTAGLGDVTLNAAGQGGNATGDGAAGGNAAGGTATITADGGLTAEQDSLAVDVSATSGGATSVNGTSSTSGNAVGGDIVLTANGGSVLASESTITLDASADAVAGENRGNAQGGTVSVTAIGSGGDSSITALDTFFVNASAGSFSTAIPASTGTATGGDIDFTADGGTISASFFSVGATAASDNTTGAGGAAQGGTIDIHAANTGVFAATGISVSSLFSVDAGAGVSQGGTPATGGRIGVVVDGGTVGFSANAAFSATGIAGGDQSAAGNIVLGRGGSILLQTLDNNLNPSAFNFTTLFASADGRARAPFEGAAFLRGTAAGNGGDVTFDMQGGQVTGNTLRLSASGTGGAVGIDDGEGRGGQAGYVQTGGDVTVGTLVVAADGFGGDSRPGGSAGAGYGGTATIDLIGGTLGATDITAQAIGGGGLGETGSDSDPANPIDGGDGGVGQGGTATVNLNGNAVVTTTTLNALASGLGGGGGDFFIGNGVAGNVGNGGDGQGGTAGVNLTAGTLTAGDITADAGGFGGNGGQLIDFNSIPSLAAVRGGNGGNGQGGTATIGIATAITATGTVGGNATGAGGAGGTGNLAGDGGAARGGTAELVVTDFNAGTVDVVLDASAEGGRGGDGRNAEGGRGGYAEGGTARVRAEGAGAFARVTNDNFVTTGTGGTGGNAGLLPGNSPTTAPRGGAGGDGRGGTIELIANDGTVDLAIGRLGVAALGSGGIGGNGGNGAGNPGSITLPGPDGILGTPDDIQQGRIGGDGGDAGGGIGGTVSLLANGGSITSGGNGVFMAANGTSGIGGIGGDGGGGVGAGGGSFGTQGGTIVLEARNSASNRGQISFGDTVIDASGDNAGRIELIADGSITMASLTADAAGFANRTNNDTDLAPAGIFMGIIDGGLIQTDGAVALTSGSSVGVYAQGTGQFNVGGNLTVTTNDQVDIRHDFRTGTGPTIQTGGSASFTAANSIRSAPGSLVSAGTDLTMTANGLNSAIDVDSLAAANGTRLIADGGRINVYGTTTSGGDLIAIARDEVAIANAVAGDDIGLQGGTIVAGRLIANGTGPDSEIDGSNIVIGTAGAASIDHAEADNDFTASAGSFATGPNSIITGGDIDIDVVDAVDLGNSSAGGSVSVDGQSIVFDTITAGTTVGLNATGTAPGAEGILGNGIVASGNVTLTGNSIRVNDSVVSSASLFAGASGGSASLSATTDGDITVNATGDIGGTFVAQGNINLTGGGNITAQATTSGGYVGPNGVSEGYVFVNAGATANLLAGSGAATMVGVSAGTNATVDGTTAGEDIYVIAGNTATVTNAVAGDDLIVTGTCCVIVDTVSTTGAGPDTRGLVFAPFSAGGPSSWQIQSASPDLSNIVLTASAGTIDAADASAFDNLTATASDVVRSTGTLRSGLVTTITGRALDLESVTAGTDILLTSASGGITAAGALSAGHDLTISSATDGVFADLAAGDDIRITATGDVTAASLLTTAAGLDNESDNSGAYIDTPGNIRITGATDTVGQTRLTAGGTADTGAITAGFTFIDAGGAVNVTGDINSVGIDVAGGSVALMNANGNSGPILLGATAGGVTVDGAITTLGGIEIDAPGAIAITGTANGTGYVQLTGGSIAVADVTSGGAFTATATGGPIALAGADVAGNIALTAAGMVTTTGPLRSGLATTISGAGLNLRAISAGGNIDLTSTAGDIVTSGFLIGADVRYDAARDIILGTDDLIYARGIMFLDAGRDALLSGRLEGNRDVTVQAARDTMVDRVIAGDDLRVTGARRVTVGTADATGGGAFDNEGNGNHIVLVSSGTLDITGGLSATNNVSLRGTSVGAQAIMGSQVSIISTVGDVALSGNVFSIDGLTIDSAGNILQGSANRMGGGALTLTADGNIAIGGASTPGPMLISAAGSVSTGALNGRAARVEAGGAIRIDGTLTGSFSIEGSEIDFGNNSVNASLNLTATNGGITSTGSINAGSVIAQATGAVSLTGDVTTFRNTDLTGASVAVGNVTSDMGDINLTATNGAVVATGTLDAGSNIVVATTQGGQFDRLVAGDDIGITGSGDVTVAFMAATGTSPDSGETGSNVTISVAGDVHVEHGEAADNFTASVAAFSTGLNSIVTGGDIDIVAAGATDLGNSTAGGHIDVDAQSIAFNTLDAADFVDLNAAGSTAGAGDIDGGTILSGSDIFLTGNGIRVDTIEAARSLSAIGTGGDVAIVQANGGGNIGVFAAGGVSGGYAAGGDIALSADGDITASANAAGGFPDPRNGDVPTAGNVFVDAGGNVTLTGSGAAGMFGVNAGGAAALTNVTAGEDMLVLAGTTARLSGVTVGDDLDVRAAGAITATGTRATGEGPDGFILTYTSNGFTIGQGEGVSSVDGADIDLRSTGGSIAAAGLSAGDDIVLEAATTLSVSGATTLGLGQTGGDSSIRTQSGDATFAGLNAFDDVVIGSSGAVSLTGPARAGRDVTIDAASVTTATLTDPADNLIDTVVAGRNLAVTAAGDIDVGAVRARNDLTLTAGTTVAVRRAVTGAGGALSLDGAEGVTAGLVGSGGATGLTSGNGAIRVDGLTSAGPVAANGDSIAIDGGSGDLVFSALNADAGDVSVTNGGNLSVTTGTVAGRATLRSTNGDLAVTQLGAADVDLAADDAMTLGSVTASDSLLGEAGGMLTVNGAVTGRDMALGSGDITIAANGRLGTTDTTRALEVRNTNDRVQTFVGGSGSRSGYHIDAAEMARLYGIDIRIFAPEINGQIDNSGGFVAAAPGGLPIGSVGSSARPDVIIDDFTMTAGASTANLGANGTLTIETPGKARVIGDVLFTGMGDANGLTIRAGDALEVILGEGTIRLTGSGSSSTATPAGLLTLVSDDVIVATANAIADVAAATDIAAIDDRLAQNDGVTSDTGALYAGGIDVGVAGGFYVQNSGTGTRFAERRGLTFGAQGLNVNSAGADTRIVINGVHLGPSGQVTGLDAIALLTINGAAVGSSPSSGGSAAFDRESTMNGCLIVSSSSCAFQEFESSFPVQDLIEEEDKESAGKNSEGQSLPTPLITMRDLDPLTGEPLLDDPVTGAGNDDLWTPPGE